MKRRAAPILGGCIVVVALGWVLSRVAGDFGRLDLSMVEPAPIALAFALLVASNAVRAMVYAGLIRSVEPESSITASVRVYLMSQVGRYIPGKLWQHAGAAYLASRLGVPVTASLVTSVYLTAAHILVGGVLSLGLLSEIAGIQQGVVVLAAVALAAGIGFASTPLFPRILHRISAKVGKPIQFPRLPLTGLLVASGTSLVVWTLVGGTVIAIFLGLYPSVSGPDLLTAVTAISAAGIAGLLAVVVPSGLGVREAAFTAIFAGSFGAAEAALVALVLRVLMTAVELGLALICFPTTRRSVGV
ncbi:MAG: lysylphosphatidylglycerol synthase domain-containing protein [Myxococcota bacterium]